MIQVRISPAQRRKLESELKDFAKKSQVAVGETVAIIGSSVAKELARKVQPYGLTRAVGRQFELSIAKQAHKAARYAEYKGINGSIEEVHRQIRAQNKKFQVLVSPPAKFQPKRKTFDDQELRSYISKVMFKAGQAKAGWVAAGESIDSPLLKTIRGQIRKIKGVSKWIRENVTSSSGKSKFIRKSGLNSTVLLTNEIGYAYSGGNANKKTWQSAIADGYKRSATMIRARLKKLK
jgi:hypothetical protein